MVISFKQMIIKLVSFLLLFSTLLFNSSCTHDIKVDGSLNFTDVGNLEFKDINNVKEYERCISDSNNFINPNPRPNQSVITRVLDSYLYIATYGNFKIRDYNNSISIADLNKVAATGKTGSVAISDAVRLGGISKIKFVDYKYKRTGLFSTEMCVILYGE